MKYRKIAGLQELEKRFRLTDTEKAYWEGEYRNKLPFLMNDYWAALCGESTDHPLRRQAIPSSEEYSFRDYEKIDPLEEHRFSPIERLVHRYRDRVLVLTTHECALYCRHCFRRHFTGLDRGEITKAQWDTILSYLKQHQEVHEVILSGGDALMLSSFTLEYITRSIGQINRPMVLRIGSRMPVTAPGLLTERKRQLLEDAAPLFLMIQVNHPEEITEESSKVLTDLRRRGITLLNQSVLLKGINDNEATLKELVHKLLELGIKPYYLFQGDLAEGTSHFRVPLKKGLALIEKLRRDVSGIAMPQFAVDLPQGGKIPLTEERLIRKETGAYYYKNLEGEIFPYPLEGEELNEG